DVLLDAPEYSSRGFGDGRGVPLVLLHGQHVYQLPAAVAQFAEIQDFLGFQGPHRRGRHLREVGDDASIDGVGLGQVVVHGLGEVAYLTGVDDDGGKAHGQQGADGGLLIGASRFQDDALGGVGPNPGDELGDAVGRVGEAAAQRGRADVDVEVVL